MNELSFLSRDIWLQQRGEQALVGNVRTGRRILLPLEALPELERFAAGRPLQASDPLHGRFLDADLVGRPAASPRLESIARALDRFLMRRLDIRKRKLPDLFPDLEDRIERTYLLALEDLERNQASAPHPLNVSSSDLNVLFDHVRSFLEEERHAGESFRFTPGFLTSTLGRPLPREDYEQQPCMPETSQRRVELSRSFLKSGSRALILGDDDLLSVYWSQTVSRPCDVFELDEELLEFLLPRLSPTVRLLQRDLTLGLPPEHHGLYDLIFTDPMYERRGMDLFMRCCAQGLSDRAEARVVFTTRPDMIEDGELFDERLQAVGLEIERREKDFSRYRLPNYYRRKLVQGFHASGLSAQLIQALSGIPYLYADLFILRKGS